MTKFSLAVFGRLTPALGESRFLETLRQEGERELWPIWSVKEHTTGIEEGNNPNKQTNKQTENLIPQTICIEYTQKQMATDTVYTCFCQF